MADYIDREKIFSIWRSMSAPASVTSLAAAISQTPAADVAEVRHGRWMDAESDDGCTVWHCSACSCPVKTIGGYPIYRHCPMCGARMGKEAEHEVSRS